jgi:pyruvate-formate lyase
MYAAMLVALDTVAEVCLFYADELKEMIRSEKSEVRKTELHIMETVLRKLPDNKPETLREAMQLVFLYNGMDGARNYGRLDEALGTIYEHDLATGQCNEEEAIRLFSSFWNLIARRNYRYDSRIIIGGKGRINETAADKIALIMIETTRRVKDIVPQLALRFYNGQNPDLYKKALDTIAEGNPFPMLYNDEVNIPSVMKAFDVPYEEAVHAIQYGCGEYVLNHRSVGTPSAVINLLEALDVTLFKGIDPLSEKPMGMPLDRYNKYGNFESFEQLWNAWCEQLEYYVDQLSRHEELEYTEAGKSAPFLYSSMLMDDCIKRGKPIFAGGIRYLGGTLESYGNSNTADSFTAIKRLVYDDKKFTLDDIRKAIKADFVGYELLQRKMLDCPKYGNDNSEADEMLVKVHNQICNYTRSRKSHTNLHSYLIVVINNDANTVIGENTPASPDGRKSRMYMNPGNAPVGGADKNGVTAFLNSIVKPRTDIHAGAVQNMKFSKEMFTDYRDKLEVLLQTYWQNGGAQAMVTVVGREDLQQAMIHPENYQNLIVRVGGFSERFVNLPRHTQEEILSRTLY